jgi:KDO2-lipid IV(A) lauroyltransferase
MRWLVERLAPGGMWLAFKIGKLMVRSFSRRSLMSMSVRAADLSFRLSRGFRERSTKNLRVALEGKLEPPEIVATARRSLRNFFHDFVEIGLILGASAEQIKAEISFRGREHLEASLAKGNGVIALSAHLGNFFLIGTRLAAEGVPMYVLINPPRNKGLAELMNRYRLMVGQRTIHARPRRQASQKLAQVLRQNEVAMVIADEFRSGSGIYVPFFGHTVLARRGPATLALRTGAAILPTYLIREPGGRLSLIIEPELELSKTGDIKADLRESTLRITQWLEKTIRKYPDQWNWMNIHWHQASDLEKNHPYQAASGEKPL